MNTQKLIIKVCLIIFYVIKLFFSVMLNLLHGFNGGKIHKYLLF